MKKLNLNPKLTPAARKYIERVIRKEMKSGAPQIKAIAIGYRKARIKGFKLPTAKKNPYRSKTGYTIFAGGKFRFPKYSVGDPAIIRQTVPGVPENRSPLHYGTEVTIKKIVQKQTKAHPDGRFLVEDSEGNQAYVSAVRLSLPGKETMFANPYGSEPLSVPARAQRIMRDGRSFWITELRGARSDWGYGGEEYAVTLSPHWQKRLASDVRKAGYGRVIFYSVNPSENPTYSQQVAQTILQQIKAIDRWALGAWAAREFVSTGENSPYSGGVRFRVSGAKFRGQVVIQLHAGRDTYDIQLWRGMSIKKRYSDIYAEDLVRVLDEDIEGRRNPGKRGVAGNLFIGLAATGVSYADRSRMQDGDYKKIAFLPYDTLELKVYDRKSKLLPAIRRDARKVKSKRGQEYQVTSSGQTVMLGKNPVYQVVRYRQGQMQDLRFHDPRDIEKLGYRITGYSSRQSLRPELRGQPHFEGLLGPFAGGRAELGPEWPDIRYEDQQVYNELSNPARENIAMGFRDKHGQFHPIRASHDYDEARAWSGAVDREHRQIEREARRSLRPGKSKLFSTRQRGPLLHHQRTDFAKRMYDARAAKRYASGRNPNHWGKVWKVYDVTADGMLTHSGIRTIDDARWKARMSQERHPKATVKVIEREVSQGGMTISSKVVYIFGESVRGNRESNAKRYFRVPKADKKSPYYKKAYELGQQAFDAGKFRHPARDRALMNDWKEIQGPGLDHDLWNTILTGWLAGWDNANLSRDWPGKNPHYRDLPQSFETREGKWWKYGEYGGYVIYKHETELRWFAYPKGHGPTIKVKREHLGSLQKRIDRVSRHGSGRSNPRKGISPAAKAFVRKQLAKVKTKSLKQRGKALAAAMAAARKKGLIAKAGSKKNAWQDNYKTQMVQDKGITRIYDKVEEIRMSGNRSPGIGRKEKFFHPFKGGSVIEGLPAGTKIAAPSGQKMQLPKNSVLLRSTKGHDLWGRFKRVT